MIFNFKTALQFQKNLVGDGDFSIAHQGFGESRSDSTPQKFSVLTINDLSYIEKLEKKKEKYPYSDVVFTGKKLDLFIYTDCPDDWYGIKKGNQILVVDRIDVLNPITVFWNVKNIEYLAMIQASIVNSKELCISIFLENDEIYFRDLNRQFCHEITIDKISICCS